VKIWDISKIFEYLNQRKIAIIRSGLSFKLIKAFTTDPRKLTSDRPILVRGNQIQGRIGNPPDLPNLSENSARQSRIKSIKYQEFPRVEAVALHQPSVPLTSMNPDSSASLELKPSASFVQLQPSQPFMRSSEAFSDVEVTSVSSVCRPDDKECNAVYDSKFWDIVKEIYGSCSDSSEILKKIEELKGYRDLLIRQGKPPGITSIWIKKLEEKISRCSN
jgi:hypothetical protein